MGFFRSIIAEAQRPWAGGGETLDAAVSNPDLGEARETFAVTALGVAEDGGLPTLHDPAGGGVARRSLPAKGGAEPEPNIAAASPSSAHSSSLPPTLPDTLLGAVPSPSKEQLATVPTPPPGELMGPPRASRSVLPPMMSQPMTAHDASSTVGATTRESERAPASELSRAPAALPRADVELPSREERALPALAPRVLMSAVEPTADAAPAGERAAPSETPQGAQAPGVTPAPEARGASAEQTAAAGTQAFRAAAPRGERPDTPAAQARALVSPASPGTPLGPVLPANVATSATTLGQPPASALTRSTAPVASSEPVAAPPASKSAHSPLAGAPVSSAGWREAPARREPERTSVHIGRIDIVIEAPALPAATPAAKSPAADVLGRLYLRGP